MFPPVLTVIKNGLKAGARATRRLTCGFVNGFDRHGTLSSKRPARASRNAGGISRWPASSWLVSLGIVVCLIAIDNPVKIVDTSNAMSVKSHITFKKYAEHKIQSNDQWKCLNELYFRESRWKVDAVGNLDGTHQVYGIPQLKNKMIKDADGYTQINYGLKYIKHRYGVDHLGYTNACKALKHLKIKGWH